MKQPKIIEIPIKDYQNTVYEWEGEGPTPFFCHATGFHGRIWDRVIDKLDGCHCISVDLRGQGKSTKTDPPYPWDSFVPDIITVIDTLNLTDIVGIGHSMGGHVITSVAAKMSNIIKGLVLCDPSLFQENRYKNKAKTSHNSHPVSKRRNEWDSPDQMYERLSSHKNFSRWEKEVLKDYCKHGLEKYKDHYKLACPPLVEASMYGAYIDPVVLKDLRSYPNPVSILLARTMEPSENFDNFGPSITRPDIGDLFPNATVTRHEKYSHFLPMENTALVADTIKGLKFRL